jgi:hypothetical protein
MSNPYLERLEREAAARAMVARDFGVDMAEYMDVSSGWMDMS